MYINSEIVWKPSFLDLLGLMEVISRALNSFKIQAKCESWWLMLEKTWPSEAHDYVIRICDSNNGQFSASFHILLAASNNPHFHWKGIMRRCRDSWLVSERSKVTRRCSSGSRPRPYQPQPKSRWCVPDGRNQQNMTISNIRGYAIASTNSNSRIIGRVKPICWSEVDRPNISELACQIPEGIHAGDEVAKSFERGDRINF